MKRLRQIALLHKPRLLRRLSKKLAITFCSQTPSTNSTKRFLNLYNNQKTESRRILNMSKRTLKVLMRRMHSTKKIFKFSRKRTKPSRSSKCLWLSASASFSRLTRSTAESWSKSCKLLFYQQLQQMDPSTNKSCCFSFLTTWLSS